MSNVWTDELHGRKGKVAKGRRPAKTRVADLIRMAGKTPEVMVQISASTVTDKQGKVTYPSPRTNAALKGLIEYVSRVSDNEKDDIEMTDEQGLTYTGRAELRDAVRGWNMPAASDRREVLHIVMSMPRDTADGSLTDVAAVERATVATAEKLFEGHNFLLVHHRDGASGNPHSHILVRMAPKNGGRRLNPRRDDLQRYRATYAHELREQGVEANATTARQRFSQTRNIAQASEQMYKARNRQKNERAARLGVTPEPDEQPNRVKKTKPDLDQYMTHMVTIKAMIDTGDKAMIAEAQKARVWLNTVASREAEMCGQSATVQSTTQRQDQHHGQRL